jgi:predicted RNA binding protein YcfA (HicA-like mRNA interferase family)
VKQVSGSQFAKILERKGWELKRVKGSHHVYMKDDNPARISIPIHGSKPLKIGLMRFIMKIAEIDESDF